MVTRVEVFIIIIIIMSLCVCSHQSTTGWHLYMTAIAEFGFAFSLSLPNCQWPTGEQNLESTHWTPSFVFWCWSRVNQGGHGWGGRMNHQFGPRYLRLVSPVSQSYQLVWRGLRIPPPPPRRRCHPGEGEPWSNWKAISLLAAVIFGILHHQHQHQHQHQYDTNPGIGRALRRGWWWSHTVTGVHACLSRRLSRCLAGALTAATTTTPISLGWGTALYCSRLHSLSLLTHSHSLSHTLTHSYARSAAVAAVGASWLSSGAAPKPISFCLQSTDTVWLQFFPINLRLALRSIRLFSLILLSNLGVYILGHSRRCDVPSLDTCAVMATSQHHHQHHHQPDHWTHSVLYPTTFLCTDRNRHASHLIRSVPTVLSLFSRLSAKV